MSRDEHGTFLDPTEADLLDMRGDGLDGDGHELARAELAEDLLGASFFKKLKKTVGKVSNLPSRITKPVARLASKVPVVGKPLAKGLRAGAQLANPLAVLRPKSFVRTQARAITSPLAAAKALAKKPAGRKPPIAQRPRPSWAKPIATAKPVARPAPRPAPRPVPKPIARPPAVLRPVPTPAPVAARPSWAPTPSPAATRPAATPAMSILPKPAQPEAPEPMLDEEPLDAGGFEEPEEPTEEAGGFEEPEEPEAQAEEGAGLEEPEEPEEPTDGAGEFEES